MEFDRPGIIGKRGQINLRIQKQGFLDDEDVVRLNRAVMVFLGLAVSPRTGRKGE